MKNNKISILAILLLISTMTLFLSGCLFEEGEELEVEVVDENTIRVSLGDRNVKEISDFYVVKNDFVVEAPLEEGENTIIFEYLGNRYEETVVYN